MRIRFTGIGLIIASMFAAGVSMGFSSLDKRLPLAQIPMIVGTCFFYLCMSFAFSQAISGPKVRLIVALAAIPFGMVAYLAFQNLGTALFVFACFATAFSYADHAMTGGGYN